VPGAKQMPNRFFSGQLLLLIIHRNGSVREFSPKTACFRLHGTPSRRPGWRTNGVSQDATNYPVDKLGSQLVEESFVEVALLRRQWVCAQIPISD
jgi:hypothetical protein